MPNRSFALTVLSPIIGGRIGGAVHAAAIRRILAELPTRRSSPLGGIPTLHFARWVVIDDVRSQGPPALEEHLQSMYLLFAADFDGELPDFLGRLLAEAGDLVQELWEHCVGFPGIDDTAAFSRYIERCRLKFSFAFASYPASSLKKVLRALDVQRRMLGFIESNQGKPADELQRAFGNFLQEIDLAPARRGGPR